MSLSIDKLLVELVNHKNILIYGPPGTGKTYLLTRLLEHLKNKQPKQGVAAIVPGSKDIFGVADEDNSVINSGNILVEWVTFHQHYSYDEFILGRRPVPADNGMKLEPYLGVLLEGAFKVSDGQSKAFLLIIDEINRANASQVFGEFVALMEPSYRTTINGVNNPLAIPAKLPGLAYKDGSSEDVLSLSTSLTVNIPVGWTFPENVFVLATMNSVDRAALPLDSALTRRFRRLELKCDLKELASLLELPFQDISTKRVQIANNVFDPVTLKYQEVAFLLLERINKVIRAEVGTDFELGHFLMNSLFGIDDDKGWSTLIALWDSVLLPQIMDRFMGRNDILRELLKAEPHDNQQYPYREVHYEVDSGMSASFAIESDNLLDYSENESIKILQAICI